MLNVCAKILEEIVIKLTRVKERYKFNIHCILKIAFIDLLFIEIVCNGAYKY